MLPNSLISGIKGAASLHADHADCSPGGEILSLVLASEEN